LTTPKPSNPPRDADRELARRQAIIETVRDAVIETDLQFRIIGWNRAAERMYGWTEADVLGRPVAEVLRSALTEEEAAAMVAELAAAGHVLTLATQRRRDGGTIEVESSVVALRDDAGQVTEYVAVNRDVSHRRRLEERLLETHHLELVGRLAGGVAHDLNSQLTAIIGYAELTLGETGLPAHVRDDLRQIVRAAERGGALTRQLLAFSRQQVLTPRRSDLNAIMANTEAARRRLAGKAVELVDRPAERLPEVVVDPSRMEQVLLDVVANAGEAMPDGGRLETETALVGGFARVTITDTGAGMDAETRARAFEPFFTTKPGHTGLGLSSVYGFLGQSGGRVALASAPGAGTTVTLDLPLG
jgi:PAS domain S-box-containing protein